MAKFLRWRRSRAFHLYGSLPYELQLRIAEMVVPLAVGVRFLDLSKLPGGWPYRKTSAADIACIHPAFKKAVEEHVFETLRLCPEDMEDFTRICVGPRRTYLKTIHLWSPPLLSVFGPLGEPMLCDERLSTFVAFRELFGALKTWDADERPRGRLLRVQYDLPWLDDIDAWMGYDSYLDYLPPVPIIGSLATSTGCGLDACALAALLSCTSRISSCTMHLDMMPPSVAANSYALRNLQSQQNTRENKLKQLTLVALRLQGRLPDVAFQPLAGQIYNLAGRLEVLVLIGVVNMAKFFDRAASSACACASASPAWPRLRRLRVEGELPDATETHQEQLGSLFGAVTDSLAQMPEIRSLDVEPFEFPAAVRRHFAAYQSCGSIMLRVRVPWRDGRGIAGSGDGGYDDDDEDEDDDDEEDSREAWLVVAKFLLPPPVMGVWSDFVRSRGCDELQVYRVKGKCHHKRGAAVCARHWEGESVEDQMRWDAPY